MQKAEQLRFDVQRPGSKGGKFYITSGGRVRYGVRAYASGSSSPAEFGGFADAGAPIGTVAGLLSRPMQAEVAKYVNAGGHVFVDSGAFGAFRQGGTVDFDKVFAVYDRLVLATRERQGLHLVMPDVIEDQGATQTLQQRYAGKIRRYMRAGVDVLIPIQLGRLRPADSYRRLRSMFGDDFTVAVPSNEAAFSGRDLDSLAGARPRRIHLLGIGASRKLKGLLNLINSRSPETVVTTDANRLRAWIGEGRPVTKRVKPILDEQMSAAARGVGEFGRYDETEFAGYIGSILTRADYDIIAEWLRLADWKEARARVADGSINDFGEYWSQIMAKLWERHTTPKVQPTLRRRVITEVAREKL